MSRNLAGLKRRYAPSAGAILAMALLGAVATGVALTASAQNVTSNPAETRTSNAAETRTSSTGTPTTAAEGQDGVPTTAGGQDSAPATAEGQDSSSSSDANMDADTLGRPSDAVLTYQAMQDAWNLHPIAQQEILCEGWTSGVYVDPATGRLYKISQREMVARTMANATPEMKAWMMPGIVAQFYNETCDAFWSASGPQIGGLGPATTRSS